LPETRFPRLGMTGQILRVIVYMVLLLDYFSVQGKLPKNVREVFRSSSIASVGWACDSRISKTH
jgi:hypothetical protein